MGIQDDSPDSLGKTDQVEVTRRSELHSARHLENLKMLRLPRDIECADSALNRTQEALEIGNYTKSDAREAMVNIAVQWCNLVRDQLGFSPEEQREITGDGAEVGDDKSISAFILANLDWTERLLRLTPNPKSRRPITPVPEDQVDSIVFTLLAIFEFLYTEVRDDPASLPGLMIQSTTLHVAVISSDSTSAANWHGTFLLNYLRCYDAATSVDRLRNHPSTAQMIAAGRLGALDALKHLFGHIFDASATQQRFQAAQFAFQQRLRDLARSAQVDADAAMHATSNGPFSLLRTGEIVALAERRNAVQSKYGSKNVEAVYESQLALLWQSLGATVIRTRRGSRTVDVLGHFSTPTDRYLFLVEAKSSTSRYALPTADQRALVEYVKLVQNSLTGYPPLRFVLICGPDPTHTVSDKVRRLSSEAGVPIRYVTASAITRLRESLVGPVDATLLEKHISLSNFVIDRADFDPLIKRIRMSNLAYSQGIKTILDLRMA